MKSLAMLSVLAVSFAQNLSAQQPIQVIVAHHEGDDVGARFTLAVQDRVAHRSWKTHGVRWQLHIVTTDDSVHKSTQYHAGLAETQSSHVRVKVTAGSMTPVESWDGSVDLANVDQQADTLVARVADVLARAETKK